MTLNLVVVYLLPILAPVSDVFECRTVGTNPEAFCEARRVCADVLEAQVTADGVLVVCGDMIARVGFER